MAKDGYVSRATEFTLTADMLNAVDDMIYATFIDKMGLPDLTEAQFAEWSAPIRLGGWGYRSQEAIAPMAWFATQAQIAPILQRSRYSTSMGNEELRVKAMKEISQRMATSKSNNDNLKKKLPTSVAEMNAWFAADPAKAKHLQAELSRLITEQTLAHLPKDPIDKERRKANATAEASKFLTTLPRSDITTMQDEPYKRNVRHRFGMRATERQMPSSCPLCDTALTNSDNDTWHPLSCRHFVPTAQNRKHNAVVQLLTATVQELGGMTVTETRPACSPNDQRRMDAKLWLNDQEFWLDATNRTLKAPSKRDKPERVISDAEKEKIAKYEDLRRKHSPRAKMVPFVTDEYGRIGPEAQKMMKEVWSFAENSSHKSKEELHEMRSSFYSKLNFILANRNMDVVGQGLGALGYAAWKQESREAKE